MTEQTNLAADQRPIRRCRRCQSWLGIPFATQHECHTDDPIIDAILSEHSRLAVGIAGDGGDR